MPRPTPSASTLYRHALQARRVRCGTLQTRAASSQVKPIELHFDKVVPPDGNETQNPLVILHGLFGTKRNWGSLSKAFAKEINRPVYALDLRNHGTSPHAEPHTYSAMATDVLNFCRTHSLTNISLLGHSMGGKVAMTVALDPETPSDLLSHLIVADIAPARGALSNEFQAYIRGMKQVEASQVNTRREADHILKDVEQDTMTRAFLLMNLEHPTAHHPHPLKFRIPIDLLGKSISELGSFPYLPGERTWEGPALFIKGEKSKYINKHNIDIAKAFFPNMVLEKLDASHWVHSERPNEFKALVTNFITSH
ncbi:Abhydrolase domain-containing protein C22H12.03 [Trametes pubescens]|uniref:Abhydrolase domain-containing protein C22H12.03 n=1 Tax=Trametes pubescens TaxID=154538 RepID=A0A1M2V6X4_TRAPU|nr:Abhydrolase domain-containing protein C22H12.03 [Trametes pubescens]